MTIKTIRTGAFSVLLLISLLPLSVSAEVYKCEDEYGDLHVSDQPCDSATYEKIVLEGEEITPTDVEKGLASATRSVFGEIVEWLYNLIYESENSTGIATQNEGELDVILRCTGKKTCGEMFSCDEAIFHYQNCPGVEMSDEDGDGIPCEDLWCQ